MDSLMRDLLDISHRYGADERFVLAGGGNTSAKTGERLYIKGSGTALATITADGFVKMDRARLAAIWKKKFSADSTAREAEFLASIMAAREAGEENKRPSVETLLHDLFPAKFVVHTHPPLVNGLTCSRQGPQACAELFGRQAAWIPCVNPGLVMAQLVRRSIRNFTKQHGDWPRLLILGNHGLVVAGDSAQEIADLTAGLVAKLQARIRREPDLTPGAAPAAAEELIPFLQTETRAGAEAPAVRFEINPEFARLVAVPGNFKPLRSSFTPDHIVYYHHEPLFVPGQKNAGKQREALAAGLAAYRVRNGHFPKIVAVGKLGVFALGANPKAADSALALFRDAVKVAAYTEAFGGPRFMPTDKINFIRNWEAEAYRKQVSA